MLNPKTIAFGALLAAASVGAFAKPAPHPAKPAPHHRAVATPEIDVRQARLEARLDAAFRQGRLDRREYRSLKREQVAIHKYEAQAKADGVVTARERRALQDMLDRAGRNLRRS